MNEQEKDIDLEESVKRYAELSEQKAKIEEEMDLLKKSITSEIVNHCPLSEYTTPDGIVAKVVMKETFKYVDEQSMIKWCKEHGYNSCIKEAIVSTTMNKELKKELPLTEGLKPMYTKTVSPSLSVKRG